MRYLITLAVFSIYFIMNSQIKVPDDVETVNIDAERLVAGKGEKKVITEGYGENPEEALNNALRNSVEEAVGALISSETRMENDEIVKDEVLSYSKGFVKEYKKLSQDKEDDSYIVMVAAIITQKQIAETLQTKGVNVSYETSGIFAQMQAWDNMKRDELELAKRLFTIKEGKKFPIAYDFNIQVFDPVRSGNNYNINTKVTALRNQNFQNVITNIKSTLNELAYEAREYAFLMDLSHNTSKGSSSNMNYNVWVNVKKYMVEKRNGKVKEKKDYDFVHLNFPEFKPVLMQSDRDHFTRHQRKRLEFMGYLDYDIIFLFSKKPHESVLTQEDKNRLNDRNLRLERVNNIYDVFQKNYSPYVLVLREEKKITFYKFLNPATVEHIGRYMTFLLEGLHFKTVFKMNDGNNKEVLNPVFTQTFYQYTSTLKTTTQNIENLYRGLVVDLNSVTPILLEEKHSFNADEFSKITNVSIEPAYDGFTFYGVE